MITAEAPNDSRTIVLAPPRRWNPTAGYAAAIAADVGRIRWLTEVDALQAAASTEPVDRGPLAYPPDARRHGDHRRAGQHLGTVQSQVDDFRSALDNEDAREVLAPYGDAVRRAGSSAWRGAPAAGQAYVSALLRQIDGLRSGVTMSSSATGDYTLASSDSPLLITLDNRLTVPVSVRIKLTTPAGFEVRDAGVADPGAAASGRSRCWRPCSGPGRSRSRARRPRRTAAPSATRSPCRCGPPRTAGWPSASPGWPSWCWSSRAVRLVRRVRARGSEARRCGRQPGGPEPAVTGWNSWDELTQELPRLPPAFFDDPVFRPGGPPPVQDVGPAVEARPGPAPPDTGRRPGLPQRWPGRRPPNGRTRVRHPRTAAATRTAGRLARSRRRDRGDPARLAGRDGRHPADPAGRTGAGHTAARAGAAGRPAGPEPEPRPGVPDDGDRLGGQPADRVPAQPGGHRRARRRAGRQRLQHGEHAAQHRLRAAARRRAHLGHRAAAGAARRSGTATAASRTPSG